MKLFTVNVTEYKSDTITEVHSFSNDGVGIQEAEDQFKTSVKAHGDNITDEEMEMFCEDGYFENGDFQVFINHSI